MPRIILATMTALAGISTYSYLYSRDLLIRYPINLSAPYNHDTLRAIIPHANPSASSSSSSSSKPTHPSFTTLDTYTQAFYSTWTLRLEGLAGRISGLAKKAVAADQEAFAGGIFVVTNRTDKSVTTEWKMPEGVQRMMRNRGVRSLLGGKQTLACTPVLGGEGVEILYDCEEEYVGEDRDVWERGVLFHRLYMRFLFDQARSKLLRGDCWT